MSQHSRRWNIWKAETRARDLVAICFIFLTTFTLFWFSPVHQVTDSNYSMVLSDCLLRKQTFRLDSCGIPVLEPKPRDNYLTNGIIYQLEVVGNHIFYFFPVGSSILSVPYVAVASVFGVSPRNPDGSFNWLGEMTLELFLAALLMAVLSSLFFMLSRMLLPFGWSLLIALGESLGTQIWSTASRGLWSHTWSVMLAGVVIYLLMMAELKIRKLPPVLLATLLAWMYFVRPTNSVVILGVTGFVFLFYRRQFAVFMLTGMGWLAIFLYYSWHNFGQLLPNYYRADRLDFGTFPVGLQGTLISPSRGLFVFVPVLIFPALLLIRHWKYRPLPRLMWLAFFVTSGMVLTISGFSNWWGGDGFGPRFTTDLVPWFVMLTVVTIKAALTWRQQRREWDLAWVIQLAFGALLLAVSVFINARGALAVETWRWNNIGLGNKLWDWRQPQFLAGLITPPLDQDYSPLVIGSEIEFANPESSNKYLWYGWSWPEAGFRWTDGKEATFIFGLDKPADLKFKMKVLPFIREGIQDQQRIYLYLNGVLIDSLVLNSNRDTQLSVDLPSSLLRQQNTLRFRLPDAASPELLKVSPDQRQLAIAIYWIEVEARPAEALMASNENARTDSCYYVLLSHLPLVSTSR